VPTTARTELSWDECEPVLAAAETAAARVLHGRPDLSLDDVFCDPALTAEFDKHAARLAGPRKTFLVRWTALKLRKEAHQLRERAEAWRRREWKFTTPVSVGRSRWVKSIPAAAGVFLVLDGEGNRVYVGAAVDLRARLEKLLAAGKLSQFDKSRDVRVAVGEVDGPWHDVLATAHCIARRSRPALNWLPAEADAVSPAPGARATRARRSKRQVVATV
jgi:hypothetical protein